MEETGRKTMRDWTPNLTDGNAFGLERFKVSALGVCSRLAERLVGAKDGIQACSITRRGQGVALTRPV